VRRFETQPRRAGGSGQKQSQNRRQVRHFNILAPREEPQSGSSKFSI
jgi:hypothetical protein